MITNDNIMTEKIKYNLWIGIVKTFKNSAILLVPFFLALLANVPIEYAPIASIISYFLKNLYEIKVVNKQ